MTEEDAWYLEYRERWRPSRVRLLLIGESAPDPRASDRRFFYAPEVSRADNLFRGVTAALYPDVSLASGQPKSPVHERLLRDGVFLIDLVPHPVNALASKARRAALLENVAGCLDVVAELEPEGVIVCHGPTFAALAPGMRRRGLPLLHERALPFPLGNWRADFIHGVRAALADSSLADLAPHDG